MIAEFRKQRLEKRIKNAEQLLASPVLRTDADIVSMIRKDISKTRAKLERLGNRYPRLAVFSLWNRHQWKHIARPVNWISLKRYPHGDWRFCVLGISLVYMTAIDLSEVPHKPVVPPDID